MTPDRFAWWKRLVSILFPPARKSQRLEIQGGGFSILENDKESINIRWEEIVEIVAFKRDLLTVDLVCFNFRAIRKGENIWILIHEEMKGFDVLTNELQRRLSEFDSDWRDKVIKPAFASSCTTLYLKPSG